MTEVFPTFKKILKKVTKANLDRYSIFLCVFSFFITAFLLDKASSYISIVDLWNLMPCVFFGFVSLVLSEKDKSVLYSWRTGLTLWFLLDIFTKVQITYFPGSSTDSIAWLFLPLYSMLVVLIGFAAAYLLLLMINKLKTKRL